MKNKKTTENFIIWAKSLYDDNCLERHRHGQQQYKTFEVYFSRHEEWLWNKYQLEDSKAKSLYLR